jgi:V8-like Glu-specific endopeptidase
MKLTHAAFPVSLAASLAGCGSYATQQADTSKIIGTNELVVVQSRGENLPPTLRPLISALGMLKKGCTVTHVGYGVAVTAGHCVPLTIPKGFGAPCWENMTIRWQYRAGLTNTITESNCVRVLASEYSTEHDFAVLAVNNAPQSHISINVQNRPPLRSQLTIFGHPQKRALEWSQYCTMELPPRNHRSSARFGHQCDTESGNSGSPIIDTASSMLVGIHNGGDEGWNYATFVFATPLQTAVSEALKVEAHH